VAALRVRVECAAAHRGQRDRGNTAEADGAGLWIGAGPFVLYRSHVNDNVAGNSGGGLHVASNGYDVQYVEFTRNRAAAAVASIWRSRRSPTQRLHRQSGDRDRRRCARRLRRFVRFSTLAQNSAPLGAAVYADTAQTLLDSDTIAGNSGGGVHNQGGVFFENTLLSGNTAQLHGQPPASVPSISTAPTAADSSRPRPRPICPNTQPLLGPLADNGGPTKTLALLPAARRSTSSPPRSGPTARTCSTSGAIRGVDRAPERLGQDVFLCDLGAYEATAPFVVNTLTDGVDADLADDLCATSGSVCTLRAAIQQANAIVGLNEISLGAGNICSRSPGPARRGRERRLRHRSAAVIRGAGVGLSTVDGPASIASSMWVHPAWCGTSWTFFRDFSITGGDAGTDNGGGIATRSRFGSNACVWLTTMVSLALQSAEPDGFFFLSDYAPVEILDSTLENNPGAVRSSSRTPSSNAAV